jgi:hypothetical protein
MADVLEYWVGQFQELLIVVDEFLGFIIVDAGSETLNFFEEREDCFLPFFVNFGRVMVHEELQDWFEV